MKRPAKAKVGDQFIFTTPHKQMRGFEPKVGTVVTLIGQFERETWATFVHRPATAKEAALLEWDSHKGRNRATDLMWSSMEPLSVAAKAPRKGTQQETILNHLKRNKYITDVTASGLYGIGQCAGCVFKLKKLGHNIKTTMREGMRGRYAEWSLQ